IVLKQDMTFTSMTLEALQLILLLIAITGFLGAIVTGITVATSGLQPINRLRRAADNVTRTGQLKQIPVYTTDELGALTQSFNNMMSALQEAQTKQKRLVADASHELKTPLTSLRTNIELLMLASKNKNVGISDKDREDIERDVIAQIEEMSTLIGDLVDLAREDEQPAVLTTFDVEDTLGECIDRVQRRRPDVTFSSSLERWVVDGDPFALSRALLNLLDNAAKWSPKGGVVRVAMFPADAERMCIEVQDSGPGIPEEDRPKIFDRFYRSISSRSMPGSGLGLAIVKQVVERHGGTVEVGESDDGGTRMTVTLPGGDQS
ncbi:MAG TPA: HAMP domain-containing histidine kinase, partial [Candidatus Corynebacterium gallistercoris]|nr:HAMP domain-containing histidine kinase [Candidatus Corynebacterium gallistercoris]